MALSFPNQCRSYDARTHCIRFWAHDASFEVPFFVNADALCHLDPNATEKTMPHSTTAAQETPSIASVNLDDHATVNDGMTRRRPPLCSSPNFHPKQVYSPHYAVPP